MRCQYRIWKICLIANFLFAFVLLFVPMTFARNQSSLDKEPVFRKQPEMHGYGTIDRIDGNVVVVNDRLFSLAEGYEKKTADDEGFSNEKLSKGLKIAYRLNDKKEIQTVWIMIQKDPD